MTEAQIEKYGKTIVTVFGSILVLAVLAIVFTLGHDLAGCGAQQGQGNPAQNYYETCE